MTRFLPTANSTLDTKPLPTQATLRLYKPIKNIYYFSFALFQVYPHTSFDTRSANTMYNKKKGLFYLLEYDNEVDNNR
jgi:hypothetical protein